MITEMITQNTHTD